MRAPLDPTLRPYRILMYAAFLAFTAVFIGCIIRSIWVDIYAPASPVAPGTATLTACVEELSTLTRKLTSHGEGALAPGGMQDWSAFTADLDRGLAAFQHRCLDSVPAGSTDEQRRLLAVAADKVDSLRLHLSRCGEEGDRERQALAGALEALRARP